MRVWETRLQVYNKIPSFPIPYVVVEEVQSNPSYRLDGIKRKGDETCQLVYTLEGEGRFLEGKKEHILLPGKAFLAQHCDPNTAYYFPLHGEQTWRFLWVSFFGKIASEMVNNIVSRYGYIYELPHNKGIIKEIKSYKNFQGTVRTFSPLAGAKFVMDILSSLDVSINKKMEFPGIELISNAQKLMNQKISEGIGVIEVARELNVSREHLSRIFHRHIGITADLYIRKEKIRFSCNLLRETNLDCKQIAERVGFNSAASFSRAFRNMLKMTPAAFRELGHVPDQIY